MTMHNTRRVPTILVALACLSLALTSAGTAHAAVPGQNGKLAFVGNEDGDDEIYSINPDGSGVTQLTKNTVTDGGPAWSPDGQQIAFASNRDGNYEIYVMGADGSNPTRLTNDASGDYHPTWSPDGQRIAFESGRDGNAEIYVMAADGSNPTRLTNDPGADNDPAWSPDGQKIAFDSARAPYGPDAEIYVMDADGSNPTPLTDNAATDWMPAWSPDGHRIVFSSNRAGPVLDFDVYVMSADGSDQTPLTTDHGFNVAPAWSPDGRRIAFNGDRADGQKVRVIDADGSGETRVTATPMAARESTPAWQSAPTAPASSDPQPSAGPASGSIATDSPPRSRITLKTRSVASRSWRAIRGTATDDHAIARVQVSIVRRVSINGHARCRALTARRRWQLYRPTGRSCAPRFLLRARGTTTWSLRLKRGMPTGGYTITTRAIDDAGQREARFSTRLGNRRTVRAR
jgi:Tol biopolymer transport system component